MFNPSLIALLLFVLLIGLFWFAVITNLRGESYKRVILKPEDSNETESTVESINRIDKTYKSLRHLPELTVLGFLVLPVALFLVPMVISNWRNRKRFIKDYQSGRIIIPNHEGESGNEDELTTMEKTEYILAARENFNGPLLVIAWYSFLAIAAGVIVLVLSPAPE